MKLNNFVTRSLTGAIYVSLIVSSILVHPYFFYIIIGIFTIISVFEFYNIVSSNNVKPQKFLGIFITIVIYSISIYSANSHLGFEYFLCLLPLFFSTFIIELFSKNTKPLQNIAYTILGIFYVALPLSLLVFIPNIGLFKFNKGIILGFFILIWTNDTFAYLVGIKLGKHRLFERVSPKKSWEGSIGGLVFSIFCAFILSRFIDSLSVLEWIGYAFIIVVFGSLGDLVESLFKRNLNIKDSGNILPGHGGILDRLDAVLIAAPFAFFYLLLIS